VSRYSFVFLLFMTAFAALALAQQQGGTPQQAPSQAKKLTRTELDQLLSDPGKVLLIDVRRPDEISSNGGFPVYLSIQVGELENHLAEIPRDRVIVTVSNHATRGGRAADLLVRKGFHVAGTVGVEDYAAEGGKIVKIEIPKQAARK
jgi:rhodanese-related sulfurtransferase